MGANVPAEAERLLTGDPVTAHLATCDDGRPHVAPLWFRYEDGVVELVTSGRKLANLRANPRVALSIERASAGIPEWHVTVLGTASVVDDEAATRTANRAINRRYGVPEDAWEGENTLVRVDVGSATHRSY
ncbi:pyridoxamine 5'-phosphate oxidase family protein [Halomarina rubra]|uniref:Pyridoxamine 5'-phosphate oxidase family protein n=1 Tax=Halomarina rubra TaxID=2071873 RepID=A0ABD6AQ60_9EURY|nr:pyridoxamine 5'-phosphate oxidase family protein [Halomarina rubra]